MPIGTMPTTVTTADGVTIALRELDGNGPPLLLAHATGFHGLIWRPMAGVLGTRYRCLAFDARGHGDSGAPASRDFAWDGFGRDVLAVVGAVGTPLVAIGHSSGAAALLLAEQSRPGTFSALYLWEPVMFPPDNSIGTLAGNKLADGARRRREQFDSALAAYENFSSRGPLSTLDPEALRAYVEGGFDVLPDGKVSLKCARDIEAAVYENGSRHDAFSHLDAVKCPVTLTCGSKTDAFGPMVLEAFAERLQDARVRVIDGLGHFGPLEDPALVASSVLEAFG